MENSTISKENHMVWKCDRTGIYSIFEYVPDLSAKACSISMSPLLVKWAIHMFINRIIMAGWLASSKYTLWYSLWLYLQYYPRHRSRINVIWHMVGPIVCLRQFRGLFRKELSSESSFDIIVVVSCNFRHPSI